jgi:hypothetical protein
MREFEEEMASNKTHRNWLRLPVVSASAEFLVQGYLMRRNILTYKAPPGNEGYDLICVHPDPRHVPRGRQRAQIRVQVKSRYATDCDRGFPLKRRSLNAFDFLVVAFLNIGEFNRGRDGTTGAREPEFYVLPAAFVRKHHEASAFFGGKVRLKKLQQKIEEFKNGRGFDLIAAALGIARPVKSRAS